jgi:hypothetical protein
MQTHHLISHVPAAPGHRWLCRSTASVESAQSELQDFQAGKTPADPGSLVVAWSIARRGNGQADPIDIGRPVCIDEDQTTYSAKRLEGVVLPDGRIQIVGGELVNDFGAFLAAVVDSAKFSAAFASIGSDL